MKKSTLSLFVILNCISFLFAQIHLNRSNLESVCECRIKNRFIKLISKNISTIDPYTFQNLTQLTNLYLDHNEITQIDKITFLGLVNIIDLTLNNNQIEEIDPITFKDLVNLANLLDLTSNKISKLYANNFQGLSLLQVIFIK
jgi:Leucine-rich repeat (LRR) protein